MFIDVQVRPPVSALISCDHRAVKLHILHISLHACYDLIHEILLRKNGARLDLYGNLPAFALDFLHKITGLMDQAYQVLHHLMAFLPDIILIAFHDLLSVFVPSGHSGHFSVLIILHCDLRIYLQDQRSAALLHCHLTVRKDCCLLLLFCTSGHQAHA